MPDDLNKRGPLDRVRINVHEQHELRYWTRELNVTADELSRAVAAVGVMAEDVRKYLRA